MRRTILCVFAICCCLQWTYAQKNILLQHIASLNESVLNDTSIAQTCKDKVSSLQNDFKQIKKNEKDSLIISKAGYKFLAESINKDFKTNCGDARIQDLSNSLRKLIKIVSTAPATTVAAATAAAAIDPLKAIAEKTVPMTIAVKGAGKDTLRELSILVMDSLKKELAIKDSSGLFAMKTVAGKRYFVHIGADNYETLDTSFIAANKKKLVFKLKEDTVVHQVVADSEPDSSKVTNPFYIPPAEQNGFGNRLGAFYNTDKGLVIAVCTLLPLFLVGSVMYLTSRGKNAKVKKAYYDEFYAKEEANKKVLDEKDTIIRELNKNIAVMQTATQPLEKPVQQPSERPVTTASVTAPATELSFVCEVMMTAGPRKKMSEEGNSNDIDLGEDVCGMVTHGAVTKAWLLDGTSDLHLLRNSADGREYFSSRLLAKSLGDKVGKYYRSGNVLPVKEAMDKAIAEVKEEWIKVLRTLPEAEQSLLTTNVRDKNFPECAATILLASLSLTGEFEGYRSGDSKMLLYGGPESVSNRFMYSSLSTKNNDSNDRIFFRIGLENDQLTIMSNEPLHEVVTQANVHTLIMFSDGIGSATEALLKQSYAEDPLQIRSEIAYQLQGTNDDKTICFIEIISK